MAETAVALITEVAVVVAETEAAATKQAPTHQATQMATQATMVDTTVAIHTIMATTTTMDTTTVAIHTLTQTIQTMVPPMVMDTIKSTA